MSTTPSPSGERMPYAKPELRIIDAPHAAGGKSINPTETTTFDSGGPS